MKDTIRKIFFNSYGDLRPTWFAIAMLGGATLVVLFLFVVVGIPIAIIEYNQCAHLESIDQVNVYDWSLWSSCRVLTPEGFYIDVDAPSVYELIHESPR